jgi:hypothetical protein
MSLKRTLPGIRFTGYKASADELDKVEQYTVQNPSIDPVWFGTTPVGGTTSVQALVLINKNADYPRNIAYAVAGSNVLGGTWVVNAKDQFGAAWTESVVIPLTANGGTVAGTKVAAQITSGTFSFLTGGSVGNGTPRLGVAIGTSAALQHRFGLPDKIAAVTDVKRINWVNNGTQTTFNGGSVTSTYVGTANHTFNGSAVVSITDSFSVSLRSSFNSEELNIQNL